MGLTVEQVRGIPKWRGSGLKMKVVKVTFDSSYPTGGEALTAATLGFDAVEFVVAEHTVGYQVVYDHANAKLKAGYYDYDAAGDGAGIEVANAADLSALVVRLLVVGY